jgi:serine/threonine protein phosphatase PrpC
MEDRLWCAPDDRAFAVADGVTAECYADADATNPSEPGLCAQAFCDTFRECLERHGLACSDGLMRTAFREANLRIGEFNSQQMPSNGSQNFLDVDLFGTVGAAGYICDHGHLHYGHIGDCRLLVEAGETVRLLTEDGVEPIRPFVRSLELSVLERKVFVRSKLRNRLYSIGDGLSSVGYGVLTGEDAALDFARFGVLALSGGDQITLFSDGVTPFIEQHEFRTMLRAVQAGLPPAFPEGVAAYWKEQEHAGARFSDDKVLISVLCKLSDLAPSGAQH